MLTCPLCSHASPLLGYLHTLPRSRTLENIMSFTYQICQHNYTVIPSAFSVCVFLWFLAMLPQAFLRTHYVQGSRSFLSVRIHFVLFCQKTQINTALAWNGPVSFPQPLVRTLVSVVLLHTSTHIQWFLLHPRVCTKLEYVHIINLPARYTAFCILSRPSLLLPYSSPRQGLRLAAGCQTM